LRPWVGAAKLSAAVERIKLAFDSRPCFLELGEEELVPEGRERQVHAELRQLRQPLAGFKAWVDFFSAAGNEHFIPVVQVATTAPGGLDQLVPQIRALFALDRGMLVRAEMFRLNVDAVVALAELISRTIGAGESFFLLLDYGKQGKAFVGQHSQIASLIKGIRAVAPGAAVAVSASSFPDAFTAIEDQDIYERLAFERVSNELNGRLIYSDRGGARAERNGGGGGLPAPRIDFAKPESWVFFRQNEPLPSPAMGYQLQASALMASSHWDEKLRLWGCQMIEKTAIGDDTGITSPNRATAARINIHLHQQLWYGNAEALYDTDEEWAE